MQRTTDVALETGGVSTACFGPVLAVHLPQHAAQHRPERPVLLAVDQARHRNGEVAS
jgi:hypothetical protein